jgi:transcriptional regulator with XRE-family HTH domain
VTVTDLDLRSGRPPARRRELTDFLRARRARLTPQDVGLPAGPRRRTAGLRREEVAQLAGVGVTWYTWLEQGRPINASVQVLDAVARTLRLDEAERAHLYRLADVPAVPAGLGLRAVPRAVLEILDSLAAMPATVINSRYDLLAHNQAHADLMYGWHSVPCEARNVLWCCFTDPQTRQRYLNFDEEAPHMVATLRASYAEHLAEPGWTDLIRALSARSSLFAALWQRHEVAQRGPRLRHFHHPLAGELRFTSTILAISGMPEHQIMIYSPGDEQTRSRLPLPVRAPRWRDQPT